MFHCVIYSALSILIYIFIQTYLYACTFICVCLCVLACIFHTVYICVHVCMCLPVSLHFYPIYIYIYVFVFYVYMFTCVLYVSVPHFTYVLSLEIPITQCTWLFQSGYVPVCVSIVLLLFRGILHLFQYLVFQNFSIN